MKLTLNNLHLYKRTYPEIGDQLDMLWHSMDNGTIPKSPEFYAAIKKVKDENPKDG